MDSGSFSLPESESSLRDRDSDEFAVRREVVQIVG